MKKHNLVLASFFNTQVDPQKKVYWKSDIKKLDPLINSVIDNKQKIIIFHDCFDNTPTLENCKFIKTFPDNEFVPTVARWKIYLDYLNLNKQNIKNAFCVDSTDVQMLNNPFEIIDKNVLYCGSEYQWKIGDRWLQKRKKLFDIVDYNDVIQIHKSKVMLNAGIVGGNIEMLIRFLIYLTELHELHSRNIKKSLDMPIFNYCVLKYFPNDYITGDLVHTPYRRKIIDSSSWWKHK